MLNEILDHFAYTKYLESASTYSHDVDRLIALVGVIVTVWFILAQVILFGFIFRFRAKEGVKAKYIEGVASKEKRWVSIPHYLVLVFDVFIIVAALKVWYTVKISMPPEYRKVQVISQQWAWTFVDPGPDGIPNTADDIRTVDELHIIKDKVYHFELSSKDVLHSFSIPAFRLKQDAVPGRVITGWFNATMTGTFDIQCTEICGIGHGIMAARLIVETEEQHNEWMKQFGPVASATAAAPTKPEAGGTP